MFEQLVEEYLPSLEDVAKKALLTELANIGKNLAMHQIAGAVAHLLLKGIDGVIEAGVKVVDQAHAVTLAHGYAAAVDEQFVQLYDAIETYIPLQATVVEFKHKFGDHAAETEAARIKRKVGIEALKSEVEDVIAAFVGDHVSD